MTSASFFPTLLALGAGATPIQYGIAAAGGAFAFLGGRALLAKTRDWRADARIKERLTSDSSPFDPMQMVFQNKRLFLRDLAPPGRRIVTGKKFINCEIIGPGNLVVALRSSHDKPYPVFNGNTFWDVDCIQVVPDVPSANAIIFPDCDFDGCNFYHLNLLFLHRDDPDNSGNWNWITPRVPEAGALMGPPLEEKVGKMIEARAQTDDGK